MNTCRTLPGFDASESPSLRRGEVRKTAAHHQAHAFHQSRSTIRSSVLPSCRQAGRVAVSSAAARSRPNAARRKPRRAATRLRASARDAETCPRHRAREPGSLRSMDTRRRPAFSACRWWRRGPSAPGRNRRPAIAETIRAPAVVTLPSHPAADRQRQRAAQRPVRCCRPRDLSAHRMRSRQSPRRCSRRCREARVGPLRPPEIRRHAVRPPRARRRADCGRGHNSRALPRPSGCHRAAPRRGRAHRPSAPGSARSTGRRTEPSSVAA